MSSAPTTSAVLVRLVLDQCGVGGCHDLSGWTVRPIGQGEQATVWLAEPGQTRAALPPADGVIVKLYRGRTSGDRRAFLSEKEGLEALAAALPDHAACGWELRAPQLHGVNAEHLALVMSHLSGQPLVSWLVTARPDLATLEVLAQTLLVGLRGVWGSGGLYGDINLKNVLCDPTARTLGLIDPGLPHPWFRCQRVSQEWYPASRDLGYLLYSVAVSVKNHMREPRARRRQLAFVSLVLQQYLNALPTAACVKSALREIDACAQVHIDNIACSWSVTGVWRGLVKRLTRRSLDGLLAVDLPTAVEVAS